MTLWHPPPHGRPSHNNNFVPGRIYKISIPAHTPITHDRRFLSAFGVPLICFRQAALVALNLLIQLKLPWFS